MPSDLNPYTPPKASLDRPEPSDVDSRVLALGRNNLGHEAAFRALGAFHFVCAGIDSMLVTMGLYLAIADSGEMWSSMTHETRVYWVAQSFVATPPLILIHLVLGWGLRRFDRWAYRGQLILSLAVLGGFFATLTWELVGLVPDFSPISKFAFGIAHFAVLYYFLASKCRRIVEPSYLEAVDATPDLKRHQNWFLLLGIVPFAIAFDWGVLVSAWKLALVMVQILRLTS
jgi:uncharacterized membrane protein YccF (DUF307 family)